MWSRLWSPYGVAGQGWWPTARPGPWPIGLDDGLTLLAQTLGDLVTKDNRRAFWRCCPSAPRVGGKKPLADPGVFAV